MKVTFFQVLQVDFLTFLNQRIYNIYLSAFCNLPMDGLVQAYTVRIIFMNGHNRFTSRRQFINDGNIEITI